MTRFPSYPSLDVHLQSVSSFLWAPFPRYTPNDSHHNRYAFTLYSCGIVSPLSAPLACSIRDDPNAAGRHSRKWLRPNGKPTLEAHLVLAPSPCSHCRKVHGICAGVQVVLSNDVCSLLSVSAYCPSSMFYCFSVSCQDAMDAVSEDFDVFGVFYLTSRSTDDAISESVSGEIYLFVIACKRTAQSHKWLLENDSDLNSRVSLQAPSL